MRIPANGLELEYADSGPSHGPVILLIMGLGTQMTRWPASLIDGLVGKGFRVIRFDNRDVGLSSKLDEAGTPDMAAVAQAVLTGSEIPVAYTLTDMAQDAVGLLDALGIARAHLVGASMGGMIAQIVAATHPDRALSLTSLMSSSGRPDLPPSSAAVSALLMSPRPDPADMEAIVERVVTGAELMGSPGYPVDRATRRAAAIDEYRRCHYPAGIDRHTAAVVADGDRRARLHRITAPTVVIHGLDDPLIPIEAARDTAAHIAGASLIEIAGMGHDVPEALVALVLECIIAVAARASDTAAIPLEGELS